MAMLANPVLMAVIGAAHGIKGELRVKTFTADPKAIGDYGPLYDRTGKAFKLVNLRPQGNVVVARFKGVADRNAAEALNGIELFVDRAALPDTDDDEEFYHADLVGMAVVDESGETIGRVSAVQNYGAGDMLEIKGPALNAVPIPFTKTAVPVVDLSARIIRIDSVASGLVEDQAAEGEPVGPSPDGFDAKRRPRGPREAGGNR